MFTISTVETNPGTHHVFAEFDTYWHTGGLYVASGIMRDTTASRDDIVDAIEMLDKLLDDRALGSDGRRNDDAVNLCIALHVLGVSTPFRWCQHVIKYHKVMVSSISKWMAFAEHIIRVEKYLDSWGPADNMGRAMMFVI